MQKWGSYEFEGPFPINEYEPKDIAGVFAVLTKPDAENFPNRYTVLLFGESTNMEQEGFNEDHDNYECVRKHAGFVENTFISIYPMTDSERDERNEIVRELVKKYTPVCNN